MRNPFINFLDLISPFLTAAILIILSIIVPSTEIQIYIPIGGPFIALQHTVTNPKLILIFFALIFLIIPAFRNYSKLYPTSLSFEAFFDADGIEVAIKKFSKTEFEMLRIEENWKKEKYNQLYLDRLNTLAKLRHLPSNVVFTESNHAHGEMILRYKKKFGWQKYQFEDIKGFMQFKFVDSRGKDTILRDEFELLPTEANIIQGTLKDIYFSWTKVVQPRFSHYVHLDPTHRFHVSDMVVIGVTKIRFFPVIDLGKTIYFIEDPSLLNKQSEIPKLIPVAYAVYDTG